VKTTLKLYRLNTDKERIEIIRIDGTVRRSFPVIAAQVRPMMRYLEGRGYMQVISPKWSYR